MSHTPYGGVGGGHRHGPRAEGGGDVLLVGDQPPGDDGLSGELGHPADDLGHEAGEDLDEVGVLGPLALDVVQGHGVQQEEPLNGHQPQLPAPAGEGGLGGDDAVGGGLAGDEVHRHLPGGQPVHQIQVDEGPLARLAHPGGGVGHGEDIAAEQENDGHVALQGSGQAVLALDGGDHRTRGQEIQELVSIHRAAPAFHGDKKGRKTAG